MTACIQIHFRLSRFSLHLRQYHFPFQLSLPHAASTSIMAITIKYKLFFMIFHLQTIVFLIENDSQYHYKYIMSFNRSQFKIYVAASAIYNHNTIFSDFSSTLVICSSKSGGAILLNNPCHLYESSEIKQ